MVRSTLTVMPTGTGKTIVMATVASRWKTGRIMCIQHREELLNQNAKKISAMCGEACGVEMADAKCTEWGYDKPRVVVASVQSLSPRRLAKFDPMEFGLILTDEAHHATAASYRRVYEHFYQNPNIKHLGVTATPDRADEEALGQIFDTVAYQYEILDAINDGWLVPIEQQFVHAEGLDLSDCKSHKNDLQDADVARIMQQEGLLHRVVDPVVQLAGDRTTLVFAASVSHAHKMAEIFNRHKPNSAHAIDGATDTEERRELLRRFSRGEFQYLCNMGVFLEGFDEPTIGCVAMARPTKSRALYAQVAGRGTRPLPDLVDGLIDAESRKAAIAASGKPSMLMLDFVGNSGRHKLVCTADILGGNESDEVIDLATSNAKKKYRKVNMQQEIEEAREQIEKAHEAARLAELRASQSRAAVVAKAKFNTKAVNPFDVFDIVPKREQGWDKGKKPSARMVEILKRFKVDDATIDGLSLGQAGQLLDVLFTRSKAGLCTVKQAKTLERFGYDAKAMPFKEASNLLNRLAANHWKRLPQG